jgi:cell division protein FtsZ
MQDWTREEYEMPNDNIDMEATIEILDDESEPKPVSIKIIGIGGAGNNVVKRMFNDNIPGVQYIAINTDVQDLKKCRATERIAIGVKRTGGRGAGMNCDVGRKCAEDSEEAIAKKIAGSELVFVVVGEGGGTGTGAAPVIARIAKAQKALVIAVVTLPFEYEKERKMKQALEGVKALQAEVDSIVVIPNEKLLSTPEAKNANFMDAFTLSDKFLANTIKNISKVLTDSGDMNTDFNDLCAIMQDTGPAFIAEAVAEGEDKVQKILDTINKNTLLETRINGAQKLLISITASTDIGLLEFSQINSAITGLVTADALVKSGTIFDNTLQNTVKVVVLATEFAENEQIIENEELDGSKSIYDPPSKKVNDSAPKATSKPNIRSYATSRSNDSDVMSDDVGNVLDAMFPYDDAE